MKPTRNKLSKAAKILALMLAFEALAQSGTLNGQTPHTGNPYADGTSGLVLTPAERESLLTYARSSRSLLEKALRDAEGLSLSDRLRIYRRAAISVVKDSYAAKPRQELLMRYVLNQALELTVGLPAADGTSIAQPGVLADTTNAALVAKVLKNSLALAVKYAADDLRALEGGKSLTELPFAELALERLTLARGAWLPGVLEFDLEYAMNLKVLTQFVATIGNDQELDRALYAEVILDISDRLDQEQGNPPASAQELQGRVRELRRVLREAQERTSVKADQRRAQAEREKVLRREEALRETAERLVQSSLFEVEHTLWGHGKSVNSASFSPDGNRIVTAGGDHTAKVWDSGTGFELKTLSGHKNLVSSATFSPDGSRIVTASWDRTAKVWDGATGRVLETLSGHGDWVHSASFSPDRSRIVTASNDSTAKVWDAATGRELSTLSGHGQRVYFASFSPDGRRILTASDDWTARVWDAATGRELQRLSGHQGGLFSASFSPDGNRIVTASSDRTAKVWDAATGRDLVTLSGHGDWVRFARFSPDGSLIVTAGEDHTAKVWDAATGRELGTLWEHENIILSAAFSPDGRRIVTSGANGTAKIWVEKQKP